MSGRVHTVAKADRLDRIARDLYGTERGGTVEALLAANVGLAGVAAMVPAGTRLFVPEAVSDEAATPATTRPWDA